MTYRGLHTPSPSPVAQASLLVLAVPLKCPLSLTFAGQFLSHSRLSFNVTFSWKPPVATSQSISSYCIFFKTLRATRKLHFITCVLANCLSPSLGGKLLGSKSRDFTGFVHYHTPVYGTLLGT